jgi:hypothetical protein
MTGQIDHRHHGVTTLGAELHSILLICPTPKGLENQGVSTIFQPPQWGSGQKPTLDLGFNKPDYPGQVLRLRRDVPYSANNEEKSEFPCLT